MKRSLQELDSAELVRKLSLQRVNYSIEGDCDCIALSYRSISFLLASGVFTGTV